MRLYHAYQEKREHMMDFITKFRANAKRATMVQSRIKAVEKMDAEAPEPVEVDAVWRFSIPNSEPLGPPSKYDGLIHAVYVSIQISSHAS
jgi:ATP-binding cassette subfamily F protein 3